jgi:hypothetical protein
VLPSGARPTVGAGGYDLALMATTICVKRIDAVLENGVWSCPSEQLRGYLEAVLREVRSRGCPDDEEMQALWVSNRVGGALIPRQPIAAHGTPRFTGSTARSDSTS